MGLQTEVCATYFHSLVALIPPGTGVPPMGHAQDARATIDRIRARALRFRHRPRDALFCFFTSIHPDDSNESARITEETYSAWNYFRPARSFPVRIFC